MNTSSTPANGTSRQNGWLRRGHRWLGIGLSLFVLLLSCTGIALNHSDNWGLGNRYVSWNWLLDAYGMRAPAPSASFSDSEHHAALLGKRLFFDQREIADGVDVLTGVVVIGKLALVTSDDSAFVLTTAGELVERLDLSQQLPGAIDRAGRLGESAVIFSGTASYQSDTGLSGFVQTNAVAHGDVAWSSPASLPASLLASIQDQYRGRGLTVERLLSDVHSGRIVGGSGPLFMDAVAFLFILLSATGLYMWLRSSGRKNGNS